MQNLKCLLNKKVQASVYFLLLPDNEYFNELMKKS